VVQKLIKISNCAEPIAPASPDWRAFLSFGFRPLYLVGAMWAALAIAVWVFAPQWLRPPLTGIAWHAHEMLWGFIGTIAVGFLLTAGANWTGRNPLNGAALAAMLVLWLIARVGFLAGGDAAFIAAAAEISFFLIAAVAMARVVVLAHNTRNYVVPVLLLALAGADAAFLYAIWLGEFVDAMRYVQVGLLVMCMITILIAGRVIPFFAARAVADLKPRAGTYTGYAQLVGTVLAIAGLLSANMPLLVASITGTGLLAIVQLIGWRPWSVRHKPLLWILYLGYAGLGVGLMVAGGHVAGLVAVSAVHVHVIAMAGFSVLIIGMITRTALGHLGRPLALDRSMLVSYVLLLTAVVFRLAALGLGPYSQLATQASALAWIGAFATYLWRFAPWLIRPRVD